MKKLRELLSNEHSRVLGIEVSDDGRIAVTLSAAGRVFTLPGEFIDSPGDIMLERVPPWFETGWLEAEFIRHGSVKGVGNAHGLTRSETSMMNTYAIQHLGWCIQEGNDLKRWELLSRFFDAPDPQARPMLTRLARELGIPKGTASVWVGEALVGKFFSYTLSLEKLVLMQSGKFDYVYFPGEKSRSDYTLLQADGWPQLPRGLLRDLLPNLDELELVTAFRRGATLLVSLSHFGQPIRLELEVQDVPERALAELHGVQDAPHGALRFVFAEAVLSGTVARVRAASAGQFYLAGRSTAPALPENQN